MRADFSRSSYDFLQNHEKHYVGVLHQQGRVWLDTDWNEDVFSRLFLLQQESRDIIGVCGTPADGSTPDAAGTPADPGTAFEIRCNEDDPRDFFIAGGPGEKGHYYVHGILAQLEKPTSFLHQPDLPGAPDFLLPFLPADASVGDTWHGVVYLEVWRRLITCLEDGSLREIALGGPDTTTRLKTIAQVKVAPIKPDRDGVSCATASRFIPGPGRGTLTTLQPKDPPPPDLCRFPDPANYTGRENRLYRVEIHNAGDVLGGEGFTSCTKLAVDALAGATALTLARALDADEREAMVRSGIVTVSDYDGQSETVPLSSVAPSGETLTLGRGLKTAFKTEKNAAVSGGAARFKWSRNNGAFAVGVADVSADRLTLKLTSLGRDSATALRAGDLVEISDDASELGPNRGYLATLSADPDPDQFTVTITDSLPANFQVARHLVLRRWDGIGWASAAFNDATTPDMNLGDGVHIQFGGRDLRVGDYWQFATRSADGSVEPLDAAKPAGIQRYRCPLAVVRWTREHDWDKDNILNILGAHQILAEEPLATVRQYLEGHPDRRLAKASIMNLAKSHAATDEKLLTLKAALTESEQNQASNLHFYVEDDCRRKFFPLTSIPQPAPNLKYVGGDGQEAEPDGTLGQALQVAVYKGSTPLSNVTVQFSITKGLGGTLNGAPNTTLESTGSDGIATCQWKLATAPAADQALPLRTQQVEVTLGRPPSREAPIRFNASLSLNRLCYVGGDGQQAGKDTRLPRPLQVAVFNDYRPVPGMKVRFTILDKLKGKLEGKGPDGNPVEGDEIVVGSGADGVAECNWTLDPAKLGTAQTVEARLLDAKEHPAPILQPIRFNAHIERADGIKVTRVLLSQTKRALPNDGTIRPTQLLEGIDLVLDREVEDLVILSRASCYVTVEAPCDLLGEQLRAAVGVGDVAFLPLVLNGTPKLAGKTTIHWEPNESTGKLLESWEKAPSRLLARLTFLGNFLWDKDKLYLDGDTFGSSDPEQASKLVLPSGDGRVGGDFRMWFWLERSPLRVSATSLHLPNAVAPSGESSQDITLESTQHVSIKKVEITQAAEGPFSVAVATPFDITPEEDKTITVKFAPKTAAAFDGTLRIEGESNRDSFDIKLHGVGQNV